jgi:gliding motility-associated-like protein
VSLPGAIAALEDRNFVAFCKSAQLFIPNAFTPDGDNVNDVFMVRSTGIASVKSFRIFNRYGEIVFEKYNFAPNTPAYGWDGNINGQKGIPAVYVYIAEVVCENGTEYKKHGNVTLLR